MTDERHGFWKSDETVRWIVGGVLGAVVSALIGTGTAIWFVHKEVNELRLEVREIGGLKAGVESANNEVLKLHQTIGSAKTTSDSFANRIQAVDKTLKTLEGMAGKTDELDAVARLAADPELGPAVLSYDSFTARINELSGLLSKVDERTHKLSIDKDGVVKITGGVRIYESKTSNLRLELTAGPENGQIVYYGSGNDTGKIKIDVK